MTPQLDMSHWLTFNAEQALEMNGIDHLKLEFTVQCDQEEAHTFQRMWQMLDALQCMLEGDVGISHVALTATVVPDVRPF